MIIILEGTNGVGKSAVAQCLLERNVGAVIWRPFRRDAGQHFGQGKTPGRMERLRECGVPVNTYVDDIYVADALATLNPKHMVILDRSMPSAIAYGAERGEFDELGQENLDWVWKSWERYFRLGSVLWVHLSAPYDVAKKRCSEQDRWHPNKQTWQRVNRAYDRLIGITRLPVKRYDSSLHSADVIATKLMS